MYAPRLKPNVVMVTCSGIEPPPGDGARLTLDTLDPLRVWVRDAEFQGDAPELGVGAR